ncbi:hypothetical protein [Piscinibacter sp.]|uniref:hypothetical protein n=1 Tax=Piscinibacter sp. TaxID=1903157 RepID=UPI002ED0C68B
MLLALAGAATRIYMKQRGLQRPAEGLDHDTAQDSADAWRPADIDEASPNAAERLREDTGSPIGPGFPTAASDAGEEIFSSSSQRGEEPIAPGLPDLTRGA